jgi:hypothetical protein
MTARPEGAAGGSTHGPLYAQMALVYRVQGDRLPVVSENLVAPMREALCDSQWSAVWSNEPYTGGGEKALQGG